MLYRQLSARPFERTLLGRKISGRLLEPTYIFTRQITLESDSTDHPPASRPYGYTRLPLRRYNIFEFEHAQNLTRVLCSAKKPRNHSFVFACICPCERSRGKINVHALVLQRNVHGHHGGSKVRVFF